MLKMSTMGILGFLQQIKEFFFTHLAITDFRQISFRSGISESLDYEQVEISASSTTFFDKFRFQRF